MENKHRQILSEMSALLASLKTQVEELEARVQECYQLLGNQEFVEEPVVEEPVVEEVVVEDEVVEVPEVESTDEVVVEIADTDGEAMEDETVDMFEMEVMDIELEPSDDLPFYDDEPSKDAAPEETSSPVAMIDAMTAKQAWRTDMPGSPVRDIRSAISLNDRILFINYLFGEDPMAFQEMLTRLNAMSTFEEAVNAVTAVHPEWDLESDTVYRFMMALRRRLQ